MRTMIQPINIDLGKKKKLIPHAEPQIIISEELGKIIPVCEPDLRGNELNYLTKCIETNWISSTGDMVPKFEDKFAEAVGSKYGIACNNGTAVLHLTLYTLGLTRGDEVIIPTFTMIATANTVRYTGATPVFIDSEEKTWNINVRKIEEKVTERTKAIVPVHTYGHPCDIDGIQRIAQKYDLWVVFDSAEAHGALYDGKKVGGLGDASTYSFYANKIITTGEGGMITTNNEELYYKSRNIRDHAFSDERHFWHQYMGYNYRMTNMQAAVGLAQIERFDELVESRIKNAMLYNSLLGNIRGITLPPNTEGIKNVYWMYSILVEDEFGISRDELRKRLAENGIETRTFFVPMHLQPIYFDSDDQDYPVAEQLCQKGMYLPSSSKLTEDEIFYIADSISRIANG